MVCSTEKWLGQNLTCPTACSACKLYVLWLHVVYTVRKWNDSNNTVIITFSPSTLTPCVLLKSCSKRCIGYELLSTQSPCPLNSVVYSTSPFLLPSFSPTLLHMFQEMELFEACYYGLVGQAHHLLTTGVNVNVTDFVSGRLHVQLYLGSQCVPVLVVNLHT